MPTSDGNTGSPVAKAQVGGNTYGEIGRSGLMISGGQVREEFLPALQGDRARHTYREMSENDPVVGVVLLAIDLLMRQVAWNLVPADHPQGEMVKDFVEGALHDMSMTWESTLSAILSMLPFGWSFHELVYKVRAGLETDDATQRSKYEDGLIGWRKWALRRQESLQRWEFDDAGGVQAMVQYTADGPKTIPMQKALLFRTSAATGNPEGRSILRNAYRPWYMKKRIEEIEAIGIERDLAGIPVAWMPPEYLANDAPQEYQDVVALVKKIVANIRRDDQESVIWPLAYNDGGNKIFDLTLLTTGGRRQFDTDPIIGRYDQRIAMMALADWILLGHEKVGSYALGASKMDMFSIALGAWLDEVASVVNDYGTPRLIRLNGWPVQAAPTLTHEDVKEIDIGKLGAAILALTQSGMPLFPDPEVENVLRDLLGLPQLPQAEGEL